MENLNSPKKRYEKLPFESGGSDAKYQHYYSPNNFDWFKMLVITSVMVGGFFVGRLINDLDEARAEIRQLELKVSSIVTTLEFIREKINQK